jgi:hypothetical protein
LRRSCPTLEVQNHFSLLHKTYLWASTLASGWLRKIWLDPQDLQEEKLAHLHILESQGRENQREQEREKERE